MVRGCKVLVFGGGGEGSTITGILQFLFHDVGSIVDGALGSDGRSRIRSNLSDYI